jgi:hypothetical protein
MDRDEIPGDATSSLAPCQFLNLSPDIGQIKKNLGHFSLFSTRGVTTAVTLENAQSIIIMIPHLPAPPHSEPGRGRRAPGFGPEFAS